MCGSKKNMIHMFPRLFGICEYGRRTQLHTITVHTYDVFENCISDNNLV